MGSKLEQQSDEELMAAYVGGSSPALDQLFLRHGGTLFRVLAKDLGTPEDARDLVQQTFLQLHLHRADYRLGAPLRPWIYTIALNLKRQYFRRKKVRPESELTQAVMDRTVEPANQSQLEHRQRLMVALDAVTDEQREVILLHWIGGLPLNEVADVLGAGLSAVKLRAHRGYARMREHLSAAEYDAEQETSNQTPGARICPKT